MLEKESAYSIESAQQQEKEAGEPNLETSIIDVIRHGPTDYKELKDPSFKFDPTAKEFKLDAKHLDLTEEGIELVKETAAELTEKIDKENEMALIVSSPSFRAHSTALIMEDYLKNHDVLMLGEGIFTTRSLEQITHKRSEDRAGWIAADTAFRKEKERHHRMPPQEAHRIIAERLGNSIGGIFTEDYEKIGERFNGFLRHVTNIYDYLSEATKQKLQGKRLRIVAVTHEEVPAMFMQKVLNIQENMKRGQILEIRPASVLREGGESITEVILYPKGDKSESGEKTIVRKFKSKPGSLTEL